MGIREARKAFEEFEREWFETPGGTRAEGVAAAFRADDLIEAVHNELPPAEIDRMIERLSHVPDVEKRWHGIKEYREMHRVKRSVGEGALERVTLELPATPRESPREVA